MGPTASGKSSLSIQLARALDCEIISVDSALVYRGMDIGTAKPGAAERSDIPHHLIDILDPVESFSTGEFRAKASQLMNDISRRGRVPLLTGGTMLYFNSLLVGLAELPPANYSIRRQLEKQAAESSWQALHQKLQLIDPESAARIHPNDPQRIERALEVYEITGKPLTLHHAEAKGQKIPYQMIKLVIAPAQRKHLHQQIALRFQQMLADGFIKEVETLYRRGDLTVKTPSMRAVGYRQAWLYLQGEYDYETMIDKAIVATRQLAKRQLTWLRREQDAAWFDTEQLRLFDKVIDNVRQMVKKQ